MAAPELKLEDLSHEDRLTLPYNHPLLDHYAERVGATLGLPRGLVNTIKNVGERSNSRQVSEAQAMGVMQIIPATQKQLGITDPQDPLQSILGGARYLAQLRKQLKTDDPATLAAAYHAGPDSKPAKGDFTGSPRTAVYAQRVAEAMKNQSPAPAPSAAEQEDIRPEDLLPNDREKMLRSRVNPDWHDPTEGNSFAQNALIGAGKFFSDTGSGLRQVGAAVLNPLARAATGRDVLSSDFEGEAERKRLDAPLMDTVGGNVGYLGASAATLALPGSAVTKAAQGARALVPSMVARATPNVVARLAPGAASAGALSTLTPTTQEGERAQNAATGAALSPVTQLAGEGVSRAARPVVDWVGRNVSLGPLLRRSWSAGATDEQRQAVRTALRNDVPVYDSQLSKPGSDLTRGRTADQLSALTRGLNRTMGADTDNIPGAIADTAQRLGQVYRSVLDNKRIDLGANFANQVTALRNQYQAAVPMRRPNAELMDALQRAEAFATQGGRLTGRQYQDMLREYAGAAKLAMKGNGDTVVSDPTAARAYSHLADLLELQAAKHLSGAELAAFKQANRQFRNMKTLESVSPTSLEGDYNPAQVARKLARSDPGAFFLNRGDTTQADLAKFGATYMGLGPNTGPRSLVKQVKDTARQMSPYVLTGVGEGALIGSQVDHSGEPGALSTMAMYGVPILASMAAVHGAKKAMNPRLTEAQLTQPRGALSELARRTTMAPGVAALIAAQREEE